MTITFLGTGTSHGVPMIACDCAVCRSTDPHDARLRTSIYVQMADGTSILVDAGPDLRQQALTYGIGRVDAILFTHGHADHTLGLDETRRFCGMQGRPMPCYGDAQTLRDIQRMFAYVFDADTPRGGGLPQLELVEIDGEISINGHGVLPVPLLHGARPVLGFRFGDFAYLTDCNRIPDASWPLLDDLEVVVLDALRERPHATHFSLSQSIEAAQRIAARQTLFTHMAHDLGHAATNAKLPERMALAYDGLRLKFRPQTTERRTPNPEHATPNPEPRTGNLEPGT
ncbi:MAG TPA: MBL fold metallo-hydrolase [Vicinamibacterales bacterium]|nr:MBL fold metallo-hydrolase [Vicinamibacterales bacterium]